VVKCLCCCPRPLLCCCFLWSCDCCMQIAVSLVYIFSRCVLKGVTSLKATVGLTFLCRNRVSFVLVITISSIYMYMI
jgi:hypothetical protein